MNWEKQAATNSVVQTTLFLELSDAEQEVIALLRQNQDGIQMNEMSVILGKTASKNILTFIGNGV
jgi:DNA processing protein